MSVQAPAPAPRARHDPADHTEQSALAWIRLLPQLQRAMTPLSDEQKAFLYQLADRRKVGGWASFFIEACLTEADGLCARRALLSIPEGFGESHMPGCEGPLP